MIEKALFALFQKHALKEIFTMCGIIGYVGLDDAKKELLKGLQALEYRGYDSAGIAYCQPNGIKTIKTVGKVSCLKDKVAKEAADDVTKNYRKNLLQREKNQSPRPIQKSPQW